MYIKPTYKILKYFLLCILLQGNTTFDKLITVSPDKCKNGLIEGPDKQFSVFVFCDDASGTSIGIIKSSPGGGVYKPDGSISENSYNVWPLEGRFWQDRAWCLDVESIKWSKDGLMLIINTSSVYGTGKQYILDLAQKKIINEKPLNSTSSKK